MRSYPTVSVPDYPARCAVGTAVLRAFLRYNRLCRRFFALYDASLRRACSRSPIPCPSACPARRSGASDYTGSRHVWSSSCVGFDSLHREGQVSTLCALCFLDHESSLLRILFCRDADCGESPLRQSPSVLESQVSSHTALFQAPGT